MFRNPSRNHPAYRLPVSSEQVAAARCHTVYHAGHNLGVGVVLVDQAGTWSEPFNVGAHRPITIEEAVTKVHTDAAMPYFMSVASNVLPEHALLEQLAAVEPVTRRE